MNSYKEVYSLCLEFSNFTESVEASIHLDSLVLSHQGERTVKEKYTSIAQTFEYPTPQAMRRLQMFFRHHKKNRLISKAVCKNISKYYSSSFDSAS